MYIFKKLTNTLCYIYMYVCMYDNIYFFFLHVRLFCKLLRFPECILPTIMYIYIFYLWFWPGQHFYIMCFNFDTFLSVL